MSRLTRDELPNPSLETKFSAANGDREISIFPVQLTTSKIGNLTRLILLLLYVMTIHTVLANLIARPSLKKRCTTSKIISPQEYTGRFFCFAFSHNSFTNCTLLIFYFISYTSCKDLALYYCITVLLYLFIPPPPRSKVNPMLGFRGGRLSVVYPEITEMQARAVAKAAAANKKGQLNITL